MSELHLLLLHLVAGLLVLKAVVTLWLGLAHLNTVQQRARKIYPHGPLGVTVVIAAYNEEVGIADTLTSVLAQDVHALQVIVVDDGSTDRTAEIVEAYAARDPRIRFLRQTNGGKASALNHALQYARHPVTVSVDADSALAPGTLRALAHHFHDLNVGAVAGDIQVAGPPTLLARLQYLEYATGQHLDKRAQDQLGVVTVVPGAAGAYRTALLRELGGYSRQTLTEDMDLTVAVLQAGYQVRFEPAAVSYTEPPLNVRALWRQRLRWMYGTFQVMGKYRHLLLSRRGGRLGMLALPYLLVYGLTLGAASPLYDTVAVVMIITRDAQGLWLPLLLSLGSDFLLTACAIYMGLLSWRSLIWTPSQRFILRPFMSLVILVTCFTLLSKRRINWNKLPRVGLHLQEMRTAPATAQALAPVNVKEQVS